MTIINEDMGRQEDKAPTTIETGADNVQSTTIGAATHNLSEGMQRKTGQSRE